MDTTPEEESCRSTEQRLAERTRELAMLLSVQQAITSRLDRQEVLQMIAFGNDEVIVPILVFDFGLDVLGFAERTDHFDLGFVGVVRVGAAR